MAKRTVHTFECDRCHGSTATTKAAEAPGLHIPRADLANKGKLGQIKDVYICAGCLTDSLRDLGEVTQKALAGRR